MSDYIQQPQMPKWLRDFANLELSKSAQAKYSSVEDMVKDLRSRVGLDLVTGEEDFQQEKVSHNKDASNKYSSRLRALIAMANILEDEGDEEGAKNIDEKIRAVINSPIEKAYHIIEHDLEPGSPEAVELSELIHGVEEGNIDESVLEDKMSKLGCEVCSCGQDKKEEKKSIFDEFPKIKQFIDNICQSRQGHVNMPAILKMVRDERPEKIDTDSEELRDYIEEKIKKEKVDLPDTGDDVAGMSHLTVFVVEEDDGNEEMFDLPAKV
jgi:hypothetical protein